MLDILPNRRNTLLNPLQVSLLLASTVGLSGCIHVLPLNGSSVEELKEAKALVKVFKSLEAPAKEVLNREHNLANDLRVALDEMSGNASSATSRSPVDAGAAGSDAATRTANSAPPANGATAPAVDIQASMQRLTGYIATLTAIRDQRKQLQDVIRQGTWTGPMVHVVQHDAISLMQDGIAQSDSWIELLQNVQLRKDFGRRSGFPEFPRLEHQLDIFLAQSPEEPLAVQVRDLQEEFRFRDEVAGSSLAAPARIEKR